MKQQHIILSLILLIITASRAQAEEGPLAAIQAQFTNAVAGIEAKHQTRMAKVNLQYMQALDKLSNKSKRGGNLDGYLAARKELERFRDDATFPAGGELDLDESVEKLRARFGETASSTEDGHVGDLVNLHDKYLRALESVKRRLVQEGRIDAAVDVNEVIKIARAKREKLAARLPEKTGIVGALKTAVTGGAKQVLPQGAVLYYRFSKRGQGALDASGSGNDGKVIGATWTRVGNRGGAYSFDGKKDYVETGLRATDLGIAGDVPRTINLWAQPRNVHAGFLFAVGSVRAALGQFALKLRDDNSQFDLDCHSIGVSGGTYESGRWSMITTAFDGDAIKIYVNGRLSGSRSVRLNTRNDDTFKIGRNLMAHHATHFDGLIDEIAVFNRALEESEIESLFQKQKKMFP